MFPDFLQLEEFRKKKAATKKAVSISQSCIDDATSCDKQLSEDGHAPTLNSTNALTDNSFSAVTGAPGVSDHNDKFHVFSHSNGSDTIPRVRFDTKNDDLSSSDLFKLPQGERSHEIPGLKYQTDSNFSEQTDDSFGNFGNDTGEGRYANILSSSRPSASQDYSKGDSNSSLYGFGKDFLNTNVSINDFAAKAYTEGLVITISGQESGQYRLTVVKLPLCLTANKCLVGVYIINVSHNIFCLYFRSCTIE